ncbi:MAG: ATP-dependent Clp protease proteolytic subunit [Pseudomonadota bacterium]
MNGLLKPPVNIILLLCLFALTVLIARSNEAKIAAGRGQFKVSETRGGAVVLAWSSPVEFPMAGRLEAAFQEHKTGGREIIIDLNSPGGSLGEGRAVVAEIEKIKQSHKVTTRVGRHGRCASMCVPIFLRGDERLAARSSRFMFHEPASFDSVTDERVETPAFEHNYVRDKFVEEFFVASPMNHKWLDGLLAQWEGRDIWKTGAELVKEDAGIITNLE